MHNPLDVLRSGAKELPASGHESQIGRGPEADLELTQLKVDIPEDVDPALVDSTAKEAGLDDDAGRQLLMEATKLASTTELADIGDRLAYKHQVFVSVLSEERIHDLNEEGLYRVSHMIFAMRRRMPIIVKKLGFERVKEHIINLLYAEAPVSERFTAFVDFMQDLKLVYSRALAAELLHFTTPATYWLWSHWLWEPEKGSGVLKVLAQEPIKTEATTEGDTYLEVGELVRAVSPMGARIGFGAGAFAVDVFLASSYAVYMFTVYRLRISQEFNRFLPELPELARRILGVQRPIKE